MSEKFKVFISRLKQHFQKKNFLMLAFAVLFIAVSVSVPVYQAQAADWLGGIIACAGDPISCGMNAFLGGLIAAGTLLLKFIYAVLVAVLYIGLKLSAFLVMFGAWLIDAMLDPRLYVGDTSATPNVPGVLTSSTVNTGWTTVRDMCNTFYIFFLLIIAFGTILRSSTFNAKNLLPKLVISLFLINFSAEITKLVIDFGQVFMYGIMGWMGTFQGGAGSLTSIVDQFIKQIDKVGWEPSFEQVTRVAFALVYSVCLGLVYVMLACFLLIRLVAFVFLIILSPIAFLSITMPSLGKYTSEWWGELVKYSIFGPIFMFFVYLSATMANEVVTNFTPIPPDINSDLNTITSILYVMIPHSVALIMLLAVVPITQKLGVAGAGKIIGGTAGLGKVAMGGYAAAKLAGGLGKKVASGVDRRTGGKASDWARKRKEEILLKIPGGAGRGTVLKDRAKNEKEKDENMKKIRVEFGEAKNRDLDEYRRKANGALATNEDKVLFAETAAAQGKLGDAKYAGDLEKFMPTIEITLSKKELEEGMTNKNLSLATETSESKARIKNLDTTGMDDRDKTKFASASNTEKKEMVKEQIMKEKMADLIRDNKTHEVQGLNDGMSAKVWHESQTVDQRKSNTTRMAKDQKGLLQKGYMANTSDAPVDMEKDIEFRTNAVKMGADLEESFKKGGSIIEADIQEAFSEFGAKEIIKFTPTQLEKYGANANSSQVRALNREGEQKKIKIIRESKQNKLIEVKADLAGIKTGPARDVLEKEEKQLDKGIKNIEDMLTGDKY